MPVPFASVQAKTASDATSAIAEALRQQGFASHIEHPVVPGVREDSVSRLTAKIQELARAQVPYRRKDGTLGRRKRRKDSLLMLAGVVSWPDSMQQIRALPKTERHRQVSRLREWAVMLREWLMDEFQTNEILLVGHTDESHPHFHFFIAGDCRLLHPGLRTQLGPDGRRIEGKIAMRIAYKQGMREFMNRYFECVARHFDMERPESPLMTARIRDRAVHQRLSGLEAMAWEMQKYLPQEAKILLQKAYNLGEYTAAREAHKRSKRPDRPQG